MSNDPNDVIINWTNTASETITNTVLTQSTTGVSSNPLITSCTESANSLIGYETFSDHSKTEKK